MKTVILMRHAKSSWKDRSIDDRDRPLNKRGRRAAPVMAHWLAAQGPAPDAVLRSPARRTRETFELMREVDPDLPEPTIVPALYEAAPATLLAQLKGLPDGWGRVLLMGHQPALGELLRLLAGTVRRAVDRRAFEKFPTAAIAVLAAEIAVWPELAPGAAELTGFAVPREVSQS